MKTLRALNGLKPFKMKDKPRYFIPLISNPYSYCKIICHIAYKNQNGETILESGQTIICYWYWYEFERNIENHREITETEFVLL